MEKQKDWIGNKASTFATLAASSHGTTEREKHDYYATEPKAAKLLLELETFSKDIWECACGEGHLSEVLKKNDYDVYCTDIVERQYKINKRIDFLNFTGKWKGDIITNPPYRTALEFVKKSIEVVETGSKIAMFLKVQFLEGKARKEFFKTNPPKKIYVSSSRLNCAKNGRFEDFKSSAVCYCWYIWEKGYRGKTTVEWFN